VADTGSPEAGSFTLAVNMSSATAQVLGIIVVALALTLAGTKLVADVFTARRTTGPRPARTKPAHSKPAAGKPGSGTGGGGSTGGRAMFLRRSRPRPVAARPGAGGPPPAPTQQIPGALPEDIT
jgi:hypothetical protein